MAYNLGTTANDRIQYSVPSGLSLADSQHWTLSCLVKFDSLPSTGFFEVFAFVDVGSTEHIGIGVDEVFGEVKPKIISNGKTAGFGTPNLSTNVWHSMVLTWDGTTFTMYIDGVEDYNVNPSSGITWASLDGLWMGNRGDGSYDLDGDICECAVWSDNISADAIASLGERVSPLMIRPDLLVFYAPLLSNTNEIIEGQSATTNGTVSLIEHPYVYYGGDPIYSLVPGTTSTPITISGNLETLVITENQATVQQDIDISISSNLESLAITEQALAVQQDIDINITTNLGNLVITELASTIDVSSNINITTNLETLTITELSAGVSVGSNIDINLANDSLVITEQALSVQQDTDINISLSSDSLTITELSSGISLASNIEISGNLETLTITEQSLGVSLGNNITIPTSTDTLTITEKQATVQQDIDISISAASQFLDIETQGASVSVAGSEIIVFKEKGAGVADTISASKLIKTIDKATDAGSITVSSFFSGVQVLKEFHYYDYRDTKIFGGYIRAMNNPNFEEYIIMGYDQQLKDILISKNYTNSSPEAIIQDAINNFTGLTYSSSISSGITIALYPVKNKSVLDIVTDMEQILGSMHRVTAEKVYEHIYAGQDRSMRTLEAGVNCVNVSGFDLDTDKLVTKLTVLGATQSHEEVELLDGDGSTATFTLQNPYVGIKVEVDSGGGFVELTPNLDGTQTGDYSIQKELSKIIFESGSIPASGTGNIRVTYTYEIELEYTTQSETILADYSNLHMTTIRKKFIKDIEDLQKYNDGYMDKFSQPLLSATFSTRDTLDITKYKLGDTIRVIDRTKKVNGAYVDKDMIIIEVERSWGQQPELLITVSDNTEYIFNRREEQLERLNQLEENFTSAQLFNEGVTTTDNLQIEIGFDILIYQTREIPSNCLYFDVGREFDDSKEFDAGDGAGGWGDVPGFAGAPGGPSPPAAD